MTAALPLRQSWLKTITMRALMVGAMVAWKGYGIENAGNLLVFLIWLGSSIAVIAAFSDAKDIIPVLTDKQKTFNELFRMAILFSLAWYGHFGLAAVHLIGVMCAMAYQSKFDANGVPLVKAGGAA